MNSEWVDFGEIYGETDQADSTLFGHTVSITYDGNRIAIGAPHYTINDNKVGAIYTYEHNGNFWIQYGETILGHLNNQKLGYENIGFSKDDGYTVSHGLTQEYIGGFPPYSVRVYQYNGDVWNQSHEIPNENQSMGGTTTQLTTDGKYVFVYYYQYNGYGLIKSYKLQDFGKFLLHVSDIFLFTDLLFDSTRKWQFHRRHRRNIY